VFRTQRSNGGDRPEGKWHRLEVQDEASVITRTHLNRPSISPSLSMIREPLE
jgi:hypothetical protein